MKKTLILVGMLSIGYARAQEGKVGINTHTPSATLDVSPSAANAVATATTNEGILAPRLSKARIANIATPVEGTLVYATDNVYSGNSPRVVKITEKGYYYYNGTEWVKAGDTKTILSGTTVPATGTGSVGDFYINTTTNTIYGPKTASGWGTGVSLVGPAGPQGAQGLQGVAGPAGARGATGATGPQGIAGAAGAKGADGKSVLSGTTVPATGTGSVGDFYINTTTNTIYGPKTASGWGTGVSLVGPAGPQGAQGLQGVAGPAGARGATGAQGPQGIAGAAGAKGADGKSVLSGTTVPATGTGSVGDFYINTTTNTIYGPKTASGWGTGVSLVGPAGPQGAQGLQGVAGPAGARGATGAQGPQGIAGAAGAKGADGKSVLSGTTVPATGTGSVGDFYINTTTNTIYGPKTASGWGTGVSLVGPAGPQGAQGLQGVAGPAGARGATGAQGPQGIAGAAGAKGADGKSVLSGTTVPATGTGSVGDFYINTATNTIYGPKTASGWGTGVSLVGPAGPQGAQGLQGVAGPAGARGATGAQGPQGIAGAAGAKGADGKSVLSGTTVPATGTGSVGDFYINTTTNTIYGPKTASGWGTGVSLVGPAGPQGAQGLQGVAGPAGARGATGATGPAGARGPEGPSGVVTASRGLIYTANTKDIALPAGTANNQVLKWNGTAWAPAADTDTNTTYTAGTGLTLTGTVFSHAAHTGDVTGTTALTIANNAVNSAKIADNSVATADLANGAVTAVKLNQMGATNGQVLKWNGTAWAPAADTNDNIYTANGTLSGNRTVTQGTNNLMFTGEGKVGFGTATPRAKVDIVGGVRASKGDAVGDGANVGYAFEGDGDTGMFAIGGAAVNGSDLILKNDNVQALTIKTGTRNVGIGTNAPGQKLEVAGGNIRAIGGLMSLERTNEGGWLELENTLKTGETEGARWRIYNMTDKTSGTTQYTPGLHFWAYSTSATQPNLGSKMLLTDEGNLGIGLGSRGVPTAMLDVSGATRIRGLSGTGDRPVAVAADGTLKVGAALQNLQGSTSVAITNNQIQRAALTGDVTAAANSNALTIANNAVTSAKIADNSVATADLANGAVTAAKLNQMGAANGQVLKWNGTAWAPAADTDTNTTYTAGQAIDITSNKISVKAPIRTVTTSVTLAATDDNGYVYVDAAGATTVTIPSTLPAGFSCIIIQQGAGQVTIAGNGVTLRTARGLKTRTQYSAVGIIKRTTAEATVTGDAIN